MNIEVTKVYVDANAIQGKVEALLDTKTMEQIHGAFARIIDPYTPFLTGKLHTDVTVSADGVTYNVPYAANKYYGEVFCKEFHPLATSHWDKVAMETQMPVLEAQVLEILKARAKELYG